MIECCRVGRAAVGREVRPCIDGPCRPTEASSALTTTTCKNVKYLYCSSQHCDRNVLFGYIVVAGT